MNEEKVNEIFIALLNKMGIKITSKPVWEENEYNGIPFHNAHFKGIFGAGYEMNIGFTVHQLPEKQAMEYYLTRVVYVAEIKISYGTTEILSEIANTAVDIPGYQWLHFDVHYAPMHNQDQLSGMVVIRDSNPHN